MDSISSPPIYRDREISAREIVIILLEAIMQDENMKYLIYNIIYAMFILNFMICRGGYWVLYSYYSFKLC